MNSAGIVTLLSLAVNVFTAVLAPFIGRKLASQQEKLRSAEETMDQVGAGLRVVDRAVGANTDALSRTGAGARIAETIRTYAPAAKQLVDAARSAARTLRTGSTAACEAEVIRKEHEERAARERALNQGT